MPLLVHMAALAAIPSFVRELTHPDPPGNIDVQDRGRSGT